MTFTVGAPRTPPAGPLWWTGGPRHDRVRATWQAMALVGAM
ncbi:hypothetical protein [Micromonospora avicenniae]